MSKAFYKGMDFGAGVIVGAILTAAALITGLSIVFAAADKAVELLLAK